MDISLQQVHYLLSLAEHLHFGRAAAACFVTQPTLSMQIKKAEAQLGAPVFDRNHSPLALTPFGKSLLPHLYELQADFDRIRQTADKAKGRFREEIRIGIIPTVASYLVPELFAHRSIFRSDVRWSVLESKTEDILELMASRKIDLGILAGPVDHPQLHSTPLFNEEILVYTKDGKDKLHVSKLQELHPWLLNQGNCLRTQMIHFCGLKEQHTPDDWDYEGGNLEMLISMVDHYGGYTLVPSFYRRAYPVLPKRLKHLYAADRNVFPARNIIALTRHRDSKRDDINSLLAFIKKSFANETKQHYEVLRWD